MDIRQTPQWGKYLSQIGWEIEKVGQTWVFIRPLPLIQRSAIKIQHPKNPLPLSKIDDIAKKYHALCVVVEPVSSGFAEKKFTRRGFLKAKNSFTHTATIYIDLQKSPETLFSSLSENARRNIKKAQTHKLTVRKIFLKDERDDSEFRKFYSLLANLTKLKKFYIPGYPEFYKKMLAFQDSSVLLFACRGKNQDPVAAVWLGLLDDTAVYMNTGITKEGYNFLANYLLVWESLQLAQKLKLKLFDFEGIFDPRFPKQRQSWQNFSEFKKRFHGQLIEYPSPYIKWYNPTLKFFYQCSKIFSK